MKYTDRVGKGGKVVLKVRSADSGFQVKIKARVMSIMIIPVVANQNLE